MGRLSETLKSPVLQAGERLSDPACCLIKKGYLTTIADSTNRLVEIGVSAQSTGIKCLRQEQNAKSCEDDVADQPAVVKVNKTHFIYIEEMQTMDKAKCTQKGQKTVDSCSDLRSYGQAVGDRLFVAV